MKILTKLMIVHFIGLCTSQAEAQLQPGFDRDEYLELLELSQQQTDTFLTVMNLEFPKQISRLYRSEKMGLENAWEYWQREDGVGVISIHGTKPSYTSWLENFYADMVPATGAVELEKDRIFRYQLAADSTAAVHAGWLIALGFLADDIVDKIKFYSAQGTTDFIIVGHSQGGAIAFLLSSYLHYLPQGILADGLRFKTYCSAAPKPGNLYYAYDFDALHFGGWAFRVVNREDWVPEMPFSIQTLDDLNEINPFIKADQGFKQLPVLQRIAIKSVYKDMAKSSEKARKSFRKTLGKRVFKLVNDRLIELKEPEYAGTVAYATAGTTIVLNQEADYADFMQRERAGSFIHHTMMAYWLCAKELPQ